MCSSIDRHVRQINARAKAARKAHLCECWQ